MQPVNYGTVGQKKIHSIIVWPAVSRIYRKPIPCIKLSPQTRIVGSIADYNRVPGNLIYFQKRQMSLRSDIGCKTFLTGIISIVGQSVIQVSADWPEFGSRTFQNCPGITVFQFRRIKIAVYNTCGNIYILSKNIRCIPNRKIFFSWTCIGRTTCINVPVIIILIHIPCRSPLFQITGAFNRMGFAFRLI